MRQGKALRAWWGITALVATVGACETTRNPIGTQRDVTAPVIVLSNTQGDTQAIANGLRFTVTANDNLGLKTIRLSYSGGYLAGPAEAGGSETGGLLAARRSGTRPAQPPGEPVGSAAPCEAWVDYRDALPVLPLVGTFSIVGFAESSAKPTMLNVPTNVVT